MPVLKMARISSQTDQILVKIFWLGYLVVLECDEPILLFCFYYTLYIFDNVDLKLIEDQPW